MHSMIGASPESNANFFEHDRRLQVLADSIAHIVWSTDAEGNFDFANARWTEFTHRPPVVGNGDSWLDCVHPADCEEARSGFAVALATEQNCEIEFRLKRWDGVYRWHLSRGVPYRDEGGRIVRWVGTATDIDDLKSSAQRLLESEGRFRDIAENIEEVFWLRNEKEEVIYVSPAFEDIWGRRCESCYGAGMKFLESVHPDDRAGLGASLGDRSDEFDVEYRIVRPDGQIRWIHDRAFPVRNEDGVVVRVAGIAQDITARKSLELDLCVQAHVLESVRQAVVSTDVSGRILSWNPFAEEVYGYSAEEAIGKSLESLIAVGGSADEETLAFEEQLVAGTRIDRERKARRKDGTITSVSLRAAPMIDATGKVTRIVRSSIDISERLRLEHQYRHAQKMEAIGRLAGGVAHDFNNMLTVIKGHSEFLSNALPLDGESRDDIDQITKAAERASGLTRQLLAFSRQQVMEKQVIDVNVLLRDFEKMLVRVIGEDIVLHLSLQPTAPPVLADASQLEQAVMNLVVNARDAMPNGGSLRLSTREVVITEDEVARYTEAKPGKYVALGVIDTGTGIEPDLLPRIFEPFFTTKDSGTGTGLGLATVYGITQQLGGFVDVASTVRKGSAFTVFLPVVNAQLAKSIKAAAEASVRGDEKILVVEDQDEVRAVARRILVTHGYTVVEARNGADALATLRDLDFNVDLVLTDAVMPQMGGADLVRALRVMQSRLPVVIVSGYTDRELVTYGTRELNVPFLPKPFRGEDLLRTVRKALDDVKS